MDNRLRLPLALLLSFAVWMVYMLFQPPPEPQDPTKPGSARGGSASGAQGAPAGTPGEAAVPVPPAVGEVLAEAEERTLVLEIGDGDSDHRVRAEFTNRGARLLTYRLGDYFDRGDLDAAERADPEHWVELLSSIETPSGPSGSLSFGVRPGTDAEVLLRGTPLEEALWRMTPLMEGERTVGVEFSYAPGSGVEFVKRVRAVPGEHLLLVELGLRNTGYDGSGGKLFRFTPASVVPRAGMDNFYVEPRAVAAWGQKGELPDLLEEERRDAPKGDLMGSLSGPGRFSFGGVHNKYFAFLLHPDPENEPAVGAVQGARYLRVYDADFAREFPDQASSAWLQIDCELDLMIQVPPQGGETLQRYRIYAGPKSERDLVAAWPAHQVLIDEDLGFFSGVAKLILGLLRFYQGIIGNWGWSIILMTFTVRLLLFPFNRRMQTSMARYQTKMKRVQPMINAVKEKYKDDPTKLRQEQGRIMQQEQAFPPLGGCLPMFLQIPVFWGLFQALRVDFELRQAPFMFWIQDLAMPDRLLDLGLELPVVGGMFQYFNVLPILMVVLWIWQQRSMPAPADENAAKMQRMMAWMPVLFGFMLYNYAAGLSLYMITSSGLGIFETRVIKKVWPVDDVEKPKKKNGFMARIAEAQKQQMRRMEEQQRQRNKQHGKRGGKKGGGGKRAG